MFYLIRILLIALPASAFLVHRKWVRASNIKARFALSAYLVAAVFVFSCLLCLLVPETYVLGFNSPEKAVRYVYVEEPEALVIGNESALAIRKMKDGSINTFLLVKQNEKWYITSPLLHFMQSITWYSQINISSIKSNRIRDRYIIITDMFGEFSDDQLVLINRISPVGCLSTLDQSQQKHRYLFYCQDSNVVLITMTIDGKDVIEIELK